jgi:RNA polymerase sigma factor (sigma-70 family)
VLDQNSRAGERLTSLYEAHAADAFRYALHLTGRREDAEDVVQHVFLQAYASIGAGRELVNPRAWLIKATKHRALNLLRDRRDTPSSELDPPAPFPADESEVGALADVRAALWSLPETQHHAFVLRHWSGLSQDEIADVLATTPGAVESLLVRARATLVAEREEAGSDCAGVRGRLARMLAPTPAHEAHLAGCRRCRTAQSRLLRASEFATAFALVPSPQVLHALASAVPGFGASGAAAGASATGAAAGTGGGGAAVSTATAATKVGLLTKVAIAATTAAVAMTAVHPLRSAVTHAIFHHAPVSAAAPAPKRSAAHARPAHAAGSARADATTPGGGLPGAPTTTGAGTTTIGTRPAKPGGAGAGNGSGNAGGGQGNGNGAGNGNGNGAGNGNGNGNGNGGGNGQGAGGATHGKSATAPGHTKAAGGAATGNGKANGATNGKGAKSNGAGASKSPGKTKTKTTTTTTTSTTTTTGGTANGNGNGNGKGNAGGATNGNAGGNGKGNGKP